MENNKKDLENVVNTTPSNGLQSDERQGKLGFFGSIGRLFKNLFLDIKTSFVYNKMKLAALLVGVPGVLLGFFISPHRAVIDSAAFFSNEEAYKILADIKGPFNGPVIYTANDMTAICFFLLMLLGILNLFTAVGLSGKKNLGSVVTATVSTVLMFGTVALYLFYLFMSVTYVNTGYIMPSGAHAGVNVGSMDFILVMISCVGSVVCSIIGCILGFINYDRTYKKSDSR